MDIVQIYQGAFHWMTARYPDSSHTIITCCCSNFFRLHLEDCFKVKTRCMTDMQEKQVHLYLNRSMSCKKSLPNLRTRLEIFVSSSILLLIYWIWMLTTFFRFRDKNQRLVKTQQQECVISFISLHSSFYLLQF